MTAADFIAEMESRFRCVQGPYRRVCQTGEPYVRIGQEIEHPVSEPEGDPIPGVIRPSSAEETYESEHQACIAGLACFNAYERHWRKANPGKQPTLYWRFGENKQAVWEPRSHGAHGRLYTRLVLSCLPVVEVSDADYDAARKAELAHDLCGGTNG